MKTKKGIFFDLYDTLTISNKSLYKQKEINCAKICGVSPEKYKSTWKSLVVRSNLGQFPQTSDRAEEVLSLLNIPKKQHIINTIVKYEHEILKNGISLYEDAITTLDTLRQSGLKLGLISNASPSVNIVIENLNLNKYFDSIVISYEVGYRKPDSRIYEIAAERLSLMPKDCIFVGDGNDQELDGAHKTGMLAIHIKREQPKHVQGIDSSTSNIDFTIHTLAELPDLVVKL